MKMLLFFFTLTCALNYLKIISFRFTADLDQPGHEQPARLKSKQNCNFTFFFKCALKTTPIVM